MGIEIVTGQCTHSTKFKTANDDCRCDNQIALKFISYFYMCFVSYVAFVVCAVCFMYGNCQISAFEVSLFRLQKYHNPIRFDRNQIRWCDETFLLRQLRWARLMAECSKNRGF